MEALYLEGHEQGPQLDVTDVAVQTDPLPGGVYLVYSSCDVRIKVAKTGADSVTKLTGAPILKGNTEKIHVSEGSRIGVVAARTGLTGKFEYHWIWGRS